MKEEVVNIKEKLKKVNDYWSPKIIEQMNWNG